MLEHDCLRMAQEAGRFQLQNNNLPSAPHIPEPMLAELRGNFGTLQTLLSVLRLSVLDPQRTDGSQEVLFCIYGDADATGGYTEDGLFSIRRLDYRPGDSPSATEATQRRRRELRAGEIFAEQGESLVFTEDSDCDSPNVAAGVVTYGSINGVKAWRQLRDPTFGELKR
jgi:hypothetical protein